MPGLAFGFGKGLDAVFGKLDFLAFQEFGDGEDLEARIPARKSFGS